MSDVKALDPALLKQYSTDFNADRANLVAANAAVSSGVLAAATDYKGERVLQNDFSIELKQGSITNKCLVHVDKYGDKLLITSCIDNLLKGAVGQAVQNMNIMFGLDQTAGLKLKPSAF